MPRRRKSLPPIRTQAWFWSLLAITSILSLIGILFVFESSVADAHAVFGDQYFFVKQHLERFAIGIIGLTVAAVTPTKVLKKLAPLMFITSLLLLGATLIPGLGETFNGAQRWLNLGGFVFQPIEILKPALILFLASWMPRHQRLGPFLFWIILPSILLLLQPDFGSLLIVLAIAVCMYFLSGGHLGIISGIGAATVGLLLIAVVVSPYRMQRVQTFINPELDPLNSSYHIRQITLALGNGGLLGQGIGNSKQKFSYIPEASSDSIFAIIAEELGFVGSLIILGLFGYWLFNCYSIQRQFKAGSFEYLVAGGILVWIGIQTILNIAAVVALVPLTGLPLPFFSYGGTALIVVLTATGIMLHLSLTDKS